MAYRSGSPAPSRHLAVAPHRSARSTLLALLAAVLATVLSAGSATSAAAQASERQATVPQATAPQLAAEAPTEPHEEPAADQATEPPPADSAPADPSGDPSTELPAPPAEAQAEEIESVENGEPDPPVDPDDPLSNEGPGEEAPATDITVPPQQTYEGQEEFKPAEILWSSVNAADRKLGDLRYSRNEAIAEVRRLRKRHKELGGQQQDLDSESIATMTAIAEATDRLRKRAVVGYQRFGSGSDPAPVVNMSAYQDVVISQRRSKMIDAALTIGQQDIDELNRMRRGLNGDAVALLDRLRIVADHLLDAEAVVAELNGEAEQAEVEYLAFKAGSEVFIHGVVFPIAGPHPPPFDSYGFPRMPGTPDEHWHEGIDLFAERGTPLVATERGVITKLGSGRLGGLKFWLKGESGSEWYYAHLDSFAPGLADGVVVEAGQLVGYVGNTGNAISTPPHLHMQLHPDGGRPVNPFPLLKVVHDAEQAEIAAGIHPGYQFGNHRTEQLQELAQPEPTTDTANEPAAPIEAESDSGAPAQSDPATSPGSDSQPETQSDSQPDHGPPAAAVAVDDVADLSPRPDASTGTETSSP